MAQIQSLLPYIQIILSIILVALILMQNSSAGAGGAFGGGDFGNVAHTKRGAEKAVFVFTIIIAILFAGSAFVALIIK